MRKSGASHFLSLFLQAALCVLAVPGARAQTPSAVERERRDREFRESARSFERAAAPVTAALELNGMYEVNWMSYTGAPDRIRVEPGKSTALVLAADIDLGDRRFSFQDGTAPKNVILIADTVRLSSRVEFDLRGLPLSENAEERKGGSLSIVSRQLVVGRNGFLTFKGRGSYYPPHAVMKEGINGGDAGSLIIGLEHLTLSEDRLQALIEVSQQLYIELLPEVIGESLNRATAERLLALINSTYTDPDVKRALGSVVMKKTRYDEQLVDLITAVQVDAIGQSVRRDANEVFKQHMVSFDLKGGYGGTLVAPRGADGSATFSTQIRDVNSRLPGGGVAVSAWVIRLYEKLRNDIYNAVRREDYVQLIQLFLSYKLFPDYPIAPEHQTAHGQLLKDLAVLRDRLVLPLRPRSLTVQAGSLPRTVDVFSEGTSLEGRMAPTEALIRETPLGDRSVLGIVKISPRNPEERVLYFTSELTADPWVASLVSKKLGETNEKYSGLFTGWELKAKELKLNGLKSSEFKVVGHTVHCRVTLDAGGDGLIALSQFASPGGVPVTFEWVYRGYPNIKGELTPIPVSLARPYAPQLIVRDGQVTNVGATALTFDYVRVRERFHSIPPLTVESGKTVTLPTLPGSDRAQVTVPPEAAKYSWPEPLAVTGQFYLVTGDELVEWISLANLLPASDESGTEKLEYVGVNIAYTIGEGGGAKEVVYGPIKLSPASAPGAETVVPLAKSGPGNVRVRISGTAHYVGGRTRELIPRVTDDLTIKISRDMLPPSP